MLSEEELEKKSKAIIEEYLHINDMKVRRGGSQAPTGCHLLLQAALLLDRLLAVPGRGAGSRGWLGGSTDPSVPTGGPAVCAGAGQPLLALRLRAEWH